MFDAEKGEKFIPTSFLFCRQHIYTNNAKKHRLLQSAPDYRVISTTLPCNQVLITV